MTRESQVRNTPLLVIAISGASSSGKTTLLRTLSSIMGDDHITHIDMDGYHLHSREEREQLNEYPEDLKANDFCRLAQDIRALKSGNIIFMPTYVHENGDFGEPILQHPRAVIFVEGLHASMLNKISGQDLVDYSVFVCPDEDLRKSWKVRRDVNERGYSYTAATRQISERTVFEQRYVFPQSYGSDILFQIERESGRRVRNNVLLSSSLCEKMQEFIREQRLDFFCIEQRRYRGELFYEFHVKNDSGVFAFLDKNVPLGLMKPQKIVPAQSKHSYQRAVETLAMLILLLCVQNYKED